MSYHDKNSSNLFKLAVAGQPDPCSVLDKKLAKEFDQFYTKGPIAERCYTSFRSLYDDKTFLMVDPSAGGGVFFDLFPHENRVGFDIDPRASGIVRADFLEVDLPTDRRIACVGNPPFGKNSSLAIRFINRAAKFCAVVGFILPATARKSSFQKRIDSYLHPVHDEDVPTDAFTFCGATRDVPAVFQIWEKRGKPRAIKVEPVRHVDFEFLPVGSSEQPDFAIQRVGASAGTVHRDLGKSWKTNYFLRITDSSIPVEQLMTKIDFSTLARNTAGYPSLAKTEIVKAYTEQKRSYMKQS